VRALPPAAGGPGKAEEVRLSLDLTVEPQLRCLEVVGVHISRAVDDHGQRLRGSLVVPKADEPQVLPRRGVIRINGRVFTASDNVPERPARRVPLLFAAGKKPSQSFKELSGSLLAHVQSPLQDLVSVANVLGAAGKKFAGPRGVWLQVHEVRRGEGGEVTVRLEVTPMTVRLRDGSGTEDPFPGVIINGRRIGEPLRLLSEYELRLLDAKGQPLQATRAVYTGKQNGPAQEYELTYSRSTNAGQVGEAARLVYRDRPSTVVEVPFTLKDVPLR
jgi:hypothetical protein